MIRRGKDHEMISDKDRTRLVANDPYNDLLLHVVTLPSGARMKAATSGATLAP
jgi:hypothetical protein